MTVSIEEFLSLRKSHPVIDVRSELEYETGHMKGAFNIPILNNQERKAVGTIYKQQGQTAAVKEGIKLVGPRLTEIISKAEEVSRNNAMLVHCWRGGMRSNNFCWLIERIGVKTFALKGGYKAYRQKASETFSLRLNLILISGNTGSGKTEILHTLKNKGEQIIDLEQLANHKGSVFGGIGLGNQPTTEQFQNDLFEIINNLDVSKRIWVEDESVAIGNVFLPELFWRQMRQAPILQVHVDKEVRIGHLVNSYGKADKELLLSAIDRISKKLGGQHAKAAREKLLAGDLMATAEILLTYYDKAYYNGIKARSANMIIPVELKNINACVDELIKKADAIAGKLII